MPSSMVEELLYPDLLLSAPALPVADPVENTDLEEAFEKGWGVVVWNDPVNLMSYVVHVFRQVLKFDEPKAQKHMMEVHHKGKSCVLRDTREKSEHILYQLQERGLKVTLERS